MDVFQLFSISYRLQFSCPRSCAISRVAGPLEPICARRTTQERRGYVRLGVAEKAIVLPLSSGLSASSAGGIGWAGQAASEAAVGLDRTRKRAANTWSVIFISAKFLETSYPLLPIRSTMRI